MAKVIKGVNDFETLYLDMAKEWHPTANGKLLPSEVASRSNKFFSFWKSQSNDGIKGTHTSS